MDFKRYLGMELAEVMNHLHLNGKEAEVQYTVPPRLTFRGTPRILKVHTAGDKTILTVSYQTSREGGVQ
ncbi:hypothetical protein V6C27_04740 [Peptococcaceae bacterium 1198_IL3148]